jgi:hypothetical protein
MGAAIRVGNPMKPDPHHAAYIGLVVALVALGFALAALGAALTVGGR